jgi:hypothetical protein
VVVVAAFAVIVVGFNVAVAVVVAADAAVAVFTVVTVASVVVACDTF